MSSSHSVYCTLSACLLHTGMQYCMNSNKTLIRTDFFSNYYNVHDIQSIQSITTHTFNGPLSRTTRVSRYQKGKTNLDFTEARDSEWQWHQLGHILVCISLQIDNHASAPPLKFFTGRMLFLPPNQQCQSTEGKV